MQKSVLARFQVRRTTIVAPQPTAKIDRVDKVPIYAQAGGSHVWLIDPCLQTLEALRLDSGSYRLVGTWHGDAKVRIEPFDAELELSALWSR